MNRKINTFLRLIKNRNINFSRFINLIKINTSIILKKKKLWGMPYILIIEPTNLCNLNCPTCPTGAGKLKRKKCVLSLNDFKSVINQLDKYLINIILMNYGEPFLNEDFYEMVKYAKSKNIHVLTCTNGHFLDAKKIINSGIDNLTISLDGINQETLAKFRKNADFKKVTTGIKELVDEKNKTITKKPIITLQFIVMKHNEDQIEQFKELAKNLGADKIAIKSLWTESLEEAKKFMPNNERYNRYAIEQNNLKRKEKTEKMCKKAWREMVINCDGSLVLCCNDYDNTITFGNIKDEKIKNIINNGKAMEIRKQITKNKLKILLCEKCPEINDISKTNKIN